MGTAINQAGDHGNELIHSYSRAQALADGVLIQVAPHTAREAGIILPVALTVAVYSEYVKVPDRVSCQDEAGRLWDILWMFRLAARNARGGQSEILFSLRVRNTNRRGMPPLVRLKAVVGPGDGGEAVLTIMLPDED